MAGKIFWLASYPKSGNTWVRALLTNYLSDSDQPADINALESGSIASARRIFDDNVGVEASDLTHEEIERYRPLVYEQLSAERNDPLFLKVHDAFTYTPTGHPLVSKEATGGVLYLIRNPLDVSVSFAHHSATTVDWMVEKMGDRTFAFVNGPRRLYNQLPQRLLTWSEHVTSWVDEPGLDVHVVRYEDMKADTIKTFGNIVRFAGLEYDPGRIVKAVDFSRFERLKKQEEERGFAEKMPRAASFFRAGVVGSWQGDLDEDLVARIIADHGAVMKRFGYLTEAGELVT